ncbi:MAG: fumarylacetoacetate hydrolase family protein [Anaerolineae bacterium]|nr:fumarylacetoacetate hydrolase family protein [Anaerolineae bacterium]
MHWVQVNQNGVPVFGVLAGETITLTALAWADVLAGRTPDAVGTLALAEADLLAPLGRPGKIVAIGQNYWDHCREQNVAPPERPIIFTKFTSAINHPGGTIRWSPALTQKVDFEAELAVVIGRTARRVAAAEALAYVFGYTVANDVTARDLQRGDGQWVRGKSLDTSCPLGPALVTADAIPDPQTLAIRSRLNGRPMQDSSTREMIFSVAHLIAFCSAAFTLEPGDVLLTGTPDGVGVFRDPPIFMGDGDVIEVEVEGIGRLRNVCRTEA